MRYGVSYYPEHKKPEEYQHDIGASSNPESTRSGWESLHGADSNRKKETTALTGWMKLWRHLESMGSRRSSVLRLHVRLHG